MNRVLDIILVDYNGMEDTRRCLDSMQPLVGENVRVRVVDNGSQPPVAEELQAAYPWVETLRSETNTGWAGGNNQAIEAALASGANYVLLLNNDTVVSPLFVERMLAAADNAPDYGILGCVVCYLDEPDVVNMDGCIFDDPEDAGFFRRQCIPQVEASPPQVVATEIVFGCCMLIRADVFRRIGLIDEKFFLIHEESDFCLRARSAGFQLGIVSEVLVWHKGSSSFQREGRPLQRYFDSRNLMLLLRKHYGLLRRRKRWAAVWMKYFRHVYYMYCVQRDLGQTETADAVLSGCVDGLFRRYGPMQERRRLLVPLLGWLIHLKAGRGTAGGQPSGAGLPQATSDKQASDDSESSGSTQYVSADGTVGS
ncbi:MAG: glycosyltransferase family 2 protein [Planctomycetaceae bacterium]|nr:glycosyltransferase family 2 protein [Planctomycetaceae bacterium]